MRIARKNKGSRTGKRGRKPKKYQRPCHEHPETESYIDLKDIQANRLEATNASIRRCNSTFRRKTNTYAKAPRHLQRTLDVGWIVRNFVVKHFTTGIVPAVALAIVDKAFKIEELLLLQVLVN
ncbi:MAG: hypothetical protein KA436_11315 [Oligoflexales bacterium]|nr:hypothetical protein [Oligoflexales bacterium]